MNFTDGPDKSIARAKFTRFDFLTARVNWYNWNLTTGTQGLKQSIAEFFARLSMPAATTRPKPSPISAQPAHGSLDCMRELRDPAGSDQHLAVYSEMDAPVTKL